MRISTENHRADIQHSNSYIDFL